MSSIRLEGIQKTYDPGKQWQVKALRDVNMYMESGKAYAITGDSGSGKSTLLNILGCLDTPTKGSYEWDGKRMTGISRNAMARLRAEKIGFVLQDFGLIEHMTGFDNCMAPAIFAGCSKAEARKRVKEVIGRMQLSFADRRVAKLSGGQKQRIAIARALVNRPKLVLADEPTGALDTKNAGMILRELLSLRDESTILCMATHNLEAAALCDERFVIRDGMIADAPKE